MRYRRPRDPDLSARVKLFVKGTVQPGTFAGKTPANLLEIGDWAWHDLNTAVKGPEESLSVWCWNGKSSRWGSGKTLEVEGEGLPKTNIAMEVPTQWISSITFLGSEQDPQPNVMIAHVVNSTNQSLTITSVRFWLPKSGATWQTLFAAGEHPVNVPIPAGDRGIVQLALNEPLPLTYAAIELKTSCGSLWEHLRIKRENFDISGGWVGDHLKQEPYLRLLSHLHVNCGQIQNVPGYTDNTFHFGEPREFSHLYALPHWLHSPLDVFRIDADGVHDVRWNAEGDSVRIQHKLSRDAIFIATKSQALRSQIESRRQAPIQWEGEHNSVDTKALENILSSTDSRSGQ